MNRLEQGFPTMYPLSVSPDEHVPRQHFGRCACTPEISHVK